MAGSKWTRDGDSITWNGYRIQGTPRRELVQYWAYSPGGGFLMTGLAENADRFKEYCENDYVRRTGGNG